MAVTCPLTASVARLDLAAAVGALGALLTEHRELLEDYEMEELVGLVAMTNDVHAHLLRLLNKGVS